MLSVFLISTIIVILAVTGVFFGIYFSVKLEPNSFVKATARIHLYDNDGNKIDTPASVDSYVSYDEISPHIIHAFVALEDKRFYKHNGVDYIRVIGAAIKNIKAGKIKQGGSTITQQLVKNSQLTHDRTFQRKIKEMKLARDIERRYTKEDIVEMYLNTIYFGNSIYGINDACRRFFGKKPSEVEPFEAAILAGVVNNPRANSPLQNSNNANKRKNLVLKLMYEQEFLAEHEYNNAIDQGYILPETIPSASGANTAYYNSVISEAENILNLNAKEILTKNYKIYTYLEQNIQDRLYKAHLSSDFTVTGNNASPVSSSSLVLSNTTGGISGYYATHNYSVFDFRRQPGSAIKPILTYAPALTSGYISQLSQFNDVRLDFNGYSPSNYKDSYLGWTDAKTALKVSSNSVAVQLLNELGVEYAKEYAKQAGLVFHENDNSLALALGGMTYGVTSLELSGAYMTIANGGLYTGPTFIKKIADDGGHTIYSHEMTVSRVFTEEASYLLTDMLMETAKTGTAKKLSILPFDIAAKTGSVGSLEEKGLNSDAWSVSYTTENTVCVWYGNLREHENDMTVTGGGMPTLLAGHIYSSMNQPMGFTAPDNIVELSIDGLALQELHRVLLATDNTPAEYIINAPFDILNAPTEYSPLFDVAPINLQITENNGIIELSFDGKDIYNYRVYRRTSTDKSLISEITGENKRISIADSSDELNLCWYIVEVLSKTGSILAEEEKPYIGLFRY